MIIIPSLRRANEIPARHDFTDCVWDVEDNYLAEHNPRDPSFVTGFKPWMLDRFESFDRSLAESKSPEGQAATAGQLAGGLSDVGTSAMTTTAKGSSRKKAGEFDPTPFLSCDPEGRWVLLTDEQICQANLTIKQVGSVILQFVNSEYGKRSAHRSDLPPMLKNFAEQVASKEPLRRFPRQASQPAHQHS